MELHQIREALNSLPPEAVARLLREVLDQNPAQAPASEQWGNAAQRVISRYEEALRRLAK